jgi:hypothetical protein
MISSGIGTERIGFLTKEYLLADEESELLFPNSRQVREGNIGFPGNSREYI